MGPPSLEIQEVDVQEKLIMTLDDSVLPDDWQQPSHPDLVAIGDDWTASEQSLGLSVPGSLIPGERNVMLLRDHPDFDKVRAGEIEDFRYDTRPSHLVLSLEPSDDSFEEWSRGF